MKKLNLVLAVFLIVCFSSRFTYAAIGDVINIRLGGDSRDSYDNGAAINDESEQTWNMQKYAGERSISNLLYSDGTKSGVSLTEYMSERKSIDANATAILESNKDQVLMRGYLATTKGATGSFNFSGLEAGCYEVYVYSQIGDGAPGNLDLTANGVEFHLSNNGDLTTLTEGQNWVSHTVHVSNDGLLNMKIASNSSINGIQLKAVTPSIEPMPEPGSVVLLGVGGIFIFGIMRLRRSEGYALNNA